MYGTIARMHLKPGAEEEVMQMSREDALRAAVGDEEIEPGGFAVDHCKLAL